MLAITDVEMRHFHICCGLGGGARGFNRGSARVGNLRARFRCIGGVDNDPAALRDFERMAGVKGTLLDLFDLEGYRAFHGHDPAPGWQPATPEDMRRAAGGERPHFIFSSPPCTGYSDLLADHLSQTPKYQALNRLTLRSIWLALEAWKDDPVEFFILENVPRIALRGRHLLDQIIQLLAFYGYVARETTHDCGLLGGLGQSRKRFLLVARHADKVPPHLYEPPMKRFQSVGDVIGRLPMPDDPTAGPMHRLQRLQFRSWLRLAFVRPGSDWRSLQTLRVDEGILADYGLLPDRPWRDDTLGVLPWGATAGTVTGRAEATTGCFSVADPREANDHREGYSRRGFLGVLQWQGTAGTVTGDARPSKGAFAVADPRGTNSRTETGRFTIVPRVAGQPSDVKPVPCASGDGLPTPTQRLVAIIRTESGDWHRPLTTLELAALQSLVDPDEHLALDGLSETAWRRRIGNAVPPAAAEAIASEMGRTLLLAWTGQTFQVNSTPIWVRNVAVALSVDGSRPGSFLN